jgi:uncharacterized membrane protein YjgN (DUF898 family)
MEPNYQPNYQQQPTIFSDQRPLPNATTTLVLGILSIVLCFICGIIALVISQNDKRLYEENPQLYTTSSYETLRAGRICAIISLALLGVAILFIVLMLVFAVSFASFNP